MSVLVKTVPVRAHTPRARGTFSHVRDAEGRRAVDQRVKICAGEESCSSQTMKEGSESTVLVPTLRSPFVPQPEC